MAETKYPVGAYRLAMKSYIPRLPGALCEVLEEGTQISHDGAPGAHMIPLDDGAKAAVEIATRERRMGSIDPVASLDLTQSGDTRLELAMAEIERLRADLARMSGQVHNGGPAPALAAPPAPPAPTLPAAPPPAPPLPGAG